MSTFIFFDVQPFSERNYHRFNIQKIKKNFKVGIAQKLLMQILKIQGLKSIEV